MAPKKQGTKGQKQILEENTKTLDFYAKVMISIEVLLVLATALYSGCYKFMASMAKPTYSSSGALIDGGMDLNQESGTAEHVKDLIILTVIVQGLGIFTDYMWLFWLLVPCRAMYLLWVYILGPWFFAQPVETEMDPKKQKKMEKKMKRAGMM